MTVAKLVKGRYNVNRDTLQGDAYQQMKKGKAWQKRIWQRRLYV